MLKTFIIMLFIVFTAAPTAQAQTSDFNESFSHEYTDFNSFPVDISDQLDGDIREDMVKWATIWINDEKVVDGREGTQNINVGWRNDNGAYTLRLRGDDGDYVDFITYNFDNEWIQMQESFNPSNHEDLPFDVSYPFEITVAMDTDSPSFVTDPPESGIGETAPESINTVLAMIGMDNIAGRILVFTSFSLLTILALAFWRVPPIAHIMSIITLFIIFAVLDFFPFWFLVTFGGLIIISLMYLFRGGGDNYE